MTLCDKKPENDSRRYILCGGIPADVPNFCVLKKALSIF